MNNIGSIVKTSALMKLDVDVFGLIHGKAGLVRYPDGRAITFLGSVNESATVWKLNYELLWEDDSPEAVAWVAEEFESLWHDSKAVDFACCPFVEADLKRLAQRKVIAVDSWLEAPDPSSVAVESPVYRKEQGLWPHQVGRSDHGTVLLAGTEVHHPTQRRFREGLFIMPTMTSTDEIADLLWVGQAAAGVAGSGASGAPPRAKGTLWASNSFQSKVYRADSAAAEFTQVYDDGRDFGSAESLAALPDGSLRFVRDGQVMRLQQGASPSSWTAEPDREASALVHAAWQALAGAYPLALA
ncbi:MAG: phospholipase D-like domain-containing protein, partial [Rectinemataceae bacterium]